MSSPIQNRYFVRPSRAQRRRWKGTIDRVPGAKSLHRYRFTPASMQLNCIELVDCPKAQKVLKAVREWQEPFRDRRVVGAIAMSARLRETPGFFMWVAAVFLPLEGHLA